MATAGFFNTNQYRDYPFVTVYSPIAGGEVADAPAPRVKPIHYRSYTALWLGGAELIALPAGMTELPQSCIVDFGAIIRPSATYNVGFDCVYLKSIRRLGSTFTFTFAVSSLPSAYAIDFVVDTMAVPEFYTQWVDSDVLAYPDTGVYACDDAPAWSAFLVTGDLAPLMQLVPDATTLVYVEEQLWRIMPGRVQSLVGSQVQSIAIANTQRTTVTPPAECEGSSMVMQDPPVAHIVDTCIMGDVTFHEGYNCSLRHDLRENAIVIAAGVGAGDGQACKEVPRYDDEPKPDGSPYYGGGVDCASVVKYINGVNSVDLKIVAGPGFIVAADPDAPNTLVIERSLNASIICVDPTLDSLSMSSSIDSIQLPPLPGHYDHD